MELPKRIDKHITESASFKIFSNVIPNDWIIREVTERDYGIDCYIEVVNDKKQVTGELISIQLKGKANGIPWTKENYYTFSGIKMSTTNYWHLFPTPVFICLVDVLNNEVFYTPVKSDIKREYFTFKKQTSFSYRIERENKLSLGSIQTFLKQYFKEKEIDLFEKELVTFVSSYHQYKHFIYSNTGRDCFMGIDHDRILFLEHFYNNIKYLHYYLDLLWDIKSIDEYKKISVSKFGDAYRLYEQEMDEVVTKLEEKMNPLMLEIKEIIWKEGNQYWMSKNNELFNIVANCNDDGSIDSDW